MQGWRCVRARASFSIDNGRFGGFCVFRLNTAQNAPLLSHYYFNFENFELQRYSVSPREKTLVVSYGDTEDDDLMMESGVTNCKQGLEGQCDK